MNCNQHDAFKSAVRWVGVSAAVIISAYATMTYAVPPPTGVAPVVVPSGGFAIDGDLVANSPVSGAGDWLAGTNEGSGGGLLDSAGRAINTNITFHFIDAFDSSDLTFSGGLKWGDDPNTWSWTSGKASSKVDINNVLFHIATDTNGHSWIIIAADRASSSGDSYIDFEFLQSPLFRTPTNTFSSGGPDGGRTVNDILLSLAFTSGGSIPDFFASRWQPNGSGYAYVDATAALPAGRVFVGANSTNIAVPYGAFGSTNYSANAFAEAAVDLTALLGAFDPCLSIGVESIMIKTKTSQSSSATIVDFIDPIQYTMKLGPAAMAGPDQRRCTEGETTAFPLNGRATPGLFPIASTQWSVVSGFATIDDPASLTTMAHVSSNATLRLTAVQANGCTETDDVVLTVLPLPVAVISGPGEVCPNSARQFQGAPGMSAYAWSVAGDGSITGAPNSASVIVQAASNCGGTYTLTLNVTNNGCVSPACTYQVTINDTNAPTMICPADVLLECPADTRTNNTGMATAQDDCGAVAVSYSDSVSNGCAGTRLISRSWTATDQCGNSANRVQFITVRDSIRPSLTVPANVVLECPADTGTNSTGTARAADGCGAVLINYSDSVSNSCGGARLISRLWTATDECGNATNGMQLITVRDTTPPVLSIPGNLVLECPADTGTNNTGMAAAEDACGMATVSFSDTVSNSCGGTKVIARLWTAIDDCNNATNRLQTITVRDSTPPSMSVPADLVLECPADTSTNNTGVAEGSDACGAVLVGYSDTVSNSCGGTKLISRLWTITDECGNQTNGLQRIAVQDTTAPTLTPPADVVLECPANTGTNNTGGATAQDSSGTVMVSYSDLVSNVCAGAKVIFRTWRAVDDCNNASSAVQTITVRDTTPPELTAPADLVLECPADTSTNLTGSALAADGCGSVTVTFSDIVSNSCGGTKVVLRTWTATDACNNTRTALQTITVQDTTAPVLTIPQDLVLECPADTRTNATGVATAQDGCSSVVVGYSDTVSNSCGGTKVIARAWTATDACGNTRSAVQTITVRDTTPPSLTIPASLVLECPADTRTNLTGLATAEDGCGAATVTYSDSLTNLCGGTKIISRTWAAVDACGNATNRTQTITVRDTTAPTLVVPADLVLECPANTSTNNTGVATAQDGCGSVIVGYSDSVTNNCGGTKLLARTWTATDECGNVSSGVQRITVRDTTPPAIVVPPDLVLECPADPATNITGTATAQDGCGQVTVAFADSVTNLCGATRKISRTWSAADECGNTVQGIQSITIRDSTAPSLTVPADLVLECPADSSTNSTGVATGQDACGNVTIRYSDSVSNSCGNTKSIARTWTVTDECGNSITRVQKITIQDTTAPALTLPADLAIECGSSTAPAATGSATAQDSCGTAQVTYSDSISNTCGGTKIVARRWTAVDSCGNSTNRVQTITVRDTTPPSLRLPANLVLECPGDTRTNVTGVPVVQDGCGTVTVGYSDVVSNGCGVTRTVLRLWTATDQCGNVTNGLQTIAVVDTTKPRITCPNITMQCAGELPAPYADLTAFLAAGGTVSDSCDAALTFSLVSDSGPVGRCPQKSTRVYRFTDDCGNYSDATQTITVDDTIAPVLTCPTNLTLECGAALDPDRTGQATATDNCSTNVSVTYTDAMIGSQYNVKWYAADPAASSGPYLPTYLKFGPGSLACADAARLTGRAADPLRNAVAYDPTSGQLDALTSLNADAMTFGQIVPFEAVIEVSGGSVRPENGTVEFTANWSTHTTSNDEFGYDKNYMVYCAFVDYADPGLIDPENNARVESYSATLENPGTIDEKILGTFRVSGFNSGDHVVVEIWVVLDATGPRNFGGTIASTLVSAQKATTPPETISIGAQTVSIGSLSKLSALPAPQEQPPLGPLPPQPPVPPGCTVAVMDRTWRATDDCGNQSSCVQRITVRDTSAPVLSAPDVVLEYPSSTGTNVTGVAQVLDGCSPASLTFSDVVIPGCGVSSEIDRTWAATDLCGNQASIVQKILVRDTTAPALTIPNDVTLECPAEASPAATGSATATDVSGTPTIEYTDSVITNCGSARIISRNWMATDACGNVSRQVQTITVQDTTAPSLVAPADIILEAPADTSTNATGVATAQDGCGSVAIGYTDTVTANCGSARVVARTWTATDTCGNQASATQTITVQDTTAPTIVAPADAVLECPADTSTNSTGIATAQDAGGSLVLEYRDVVTTNCGSTRVIARTWTATDPCGNAANAPQSITVQDTTAPEMACVVAEAVGTNVLTLLEANYLDVFTNGVSIGVSENTGYLYWAPDHTGLVSLEAAIAETPYPSGPLLETATNSATTIGNGKLAHEAILLTLNIGFNAAGVIGMAPNNFGELIYSAPGDALNALTVSQILETANRVLAGAELPPGYTYESLTALLAQLNAAFEDHKTTTWAKTYLSSPMVVVQCESQIPASDPAWVVASDGCSSPVIISELADTMKDYKSAVRYTLTRTWTATDACGNVATSSFDIRVDDTTAPGLIVNSNRTVLAGQTWDFDDPVATDNCGGGVTVRVAGTVTNLLKASEVVVVRSWEATDQSGNTSACQQAVTILSPVDPPTITSGPVSQNGTVGGGTLLSVSASGSGLSYQWRLNGRNLGGATGSTLNLNGLQFTNAGVYTVVVSNSAGSAISSAAIIDVYPKLTIERVAGGVRLTWPAPFILQAAGTINGFYADVPGATSPYLDSSIGTPQRFFRLRSDPFALRMTSVGAQRGVQVTGAPGLNYIIQGSTNLVDWVNLQTNTAPCAFGDPQAASLPARFYRVVLAAARLSSPSQQPPVISSQPAAQTIGFGRPSVLSVAATGSALNYQWMRNGTNIPGATTSGLALSNVGYGDAGLYTVLISNGAGAVTSSVAIVNIAPELKIHLAGNQLALTWDGDFVLQTAASPGGTFTDLVGASSPYLASPVGPQAFFRLRAQLGALQPTLLPNQRISLSATGSLGTVYLIQASSDLVHWTTMFTSTLPYSFEDSTTAQPSRFYRAIPAP